MIEECTLEQLRTLRLKDLDGNIRSDLIMPTLQEYIRICKKYGKAAVLELKNRFLPDDIQTIVEIIRKEGWLDHTVFISFVLDNMICLRGLLPDQPLQYLVKTLTQARLEMLARYRLDLDIEHVNLTAEQVNQIHTLGLKINVWTVDDPQVAENLIRMGVDFITSNILE